MSACCVTLVKKNAHLPHVNSAFFDFASLASEHFDSDTDFLDGLYIFNNSLHAEVSIPTPASIISSGKS